MAAALVNRAYLARAYLIHNDHVWRVVLDGLHKDVRLLLARWHHQAARVSDARVALVGIACAHDSAAPLTHTTQHTNTS